MTGMTLRGTKSPTNF